MTVGCTSLGSFSSKFTEIVGETPSAYRERDHSAVTAMPACVAKVRTRPTRESAARRVADGDASGIEQESRSTPPGRRLT
jgi:hypothetical protein